MRDSWGSGAKVIQDNAESEVRDMSREIDDSIIWATDEQTVTAIHEALDGEEWSIDTLDYIATLVARTGRKINEPGFYDGEDD